MALRFECDIHKAKANIQKHGISFDEAATVFLDGLGRIFDDVSHSLEEHREIVIGHSVAGRLLLVSFTEKENGTVRIISARAATKRERGDYEKKDTN